MERCKQDRLGLGPKFLASKLERGELSRINGGSSGLGSRIWREVLAGLDVCESGRI